MQILPMLCRSLAELEQSQLELPRMHIKMQNDLLSLYVEEFHTISNGQANFNNLQLCTSIDVELSTRKRLPASVVEEHSRCGFM